MFCLKFASELMNYTDRYDMMYVMLCCLVYHHDLIVIFVRRDITFPVVRPSVHLPVRQALTGTTLYSTYLIDRLQLNFDNGR